MILTALAASMVVNALVTGLIVFKIHKVFLQVKQVNPEATSVERTLDSLSSTGGTKLRQIIFIIIESGMALFAIQLVRFVLNSLTVFQVAPQTPLGLTFLIDLVIVVNDMLNVIMKSAHFFLLLLFY